jgi:hypothetical protein
MDNALNKRQLDELLASSRELVERFEGYRDSADSGDELGDLAAMLLQGFGSSVDMAKQLVAAHGVLEQAAGTQQVGAPGSHSAVQEEAVRRHVESLQKRSQAARRAHG